MVIFHSYVSYQRVVQGWDCGLYITTQYYTNSQSWEAAFCSDPDASSGSGRTGAGEGTVLKPQVTMGFTSKSWSKDLDDLGSFVCDCLVVLHYTCMQHVWEILRVSLLFQKGGPSKKCHERRDWISAVLNGTSRINQTARLLGRLVAWTPTPFLATQRAWLHEGTNHINHAS